jgi:hypothetical protein
MFPICKAKQLGITIKIVLITNQTKLSKIGGIDPKMETLPFDYFYKGACSRKW